MKFVSNQSTVAHRGQSRAGLATLHLGRVQKYTPAGSALQNSTLPHAVSTGGKL